MSIYIRGDIHGDAIAAFSFKRHPGLRELTKDDIVIVLGDFGLPFGIRRKGYDPKEDRYHIQFLRGKPWTTIAIAGNHDDRCAISDMPVVERWGGQVRQFTFEGISYNNVYYVDSPQILDIQGEHILMIPGAESHDIQDGILDPEDPNYLHMRKKLVTNNKYYFRIKNWDWWEDEAVNVFAAKQLLKDNSDHFNLILSHDYPGLVSYHVAPTGFRLKATKGEEYLEELRTTLDFDAWFFGHLHYDLWQDPEDERLMCLYKSILQVS